jgi:hypothetical protein
LRNPEAKIFNSQEEPVMFDFNRLLKLGSFRASVDFDRMLNWKLLRGSHEFPGPDGGTCINEAAIVAAGYVYRSVQSIDDCPASFSRPMALFALCLNDMLDDDLRQELLIPFVTRLGGSADTPEVELKRAELILQRTAANVLAPALARAGFPELAEQCRAFKTRNELIEVARSLRGDSRSSVHPLLIAACDSAADGAQQWLAQRPAEVVRCASHVVGEIASVIGDSVPRTGRERAVAKVYRQAAEILDAALKIGKQAETTGMDVVAGRMEKARQNSGRVRSLSFGCDPL